MVAGAWASGIALLLACPTPLAFAAVPGPLGFARPAVLSPRQPAPLSWSMLLCSCPGLCSVSLPFLLALLVLVAAVARWDERVG